MDPDVDVDAHWPMAQRRARRLVRQLAAEGVTQDAIANRLGVSQGMINGILSGQKKPELKVINGAIERLRIAPRFFWGDEEPGNYKEYQREDAWMTEEHEDTPGWLEFVEFGLVEYFRRRGLSDRDLEYVRRAPGRRGDLTIAFYKSICSVLLGGAAPLPEFDEVASRDRGPDASHLVKPRKDPQGDSDGHPEDR